MAKVYALRKFTDPSGTEHEIGDGFDLPRNTDQQKADFDRLIAEETVTQSERKADPEPDSDESQRSGRRSRS